MRDKAGEFLLKLFKNKRKRVEKNIGEDIWAKNLFSDLGKLGGRLIVERTR